MPSKKIKVKKKVKTNAQRRDKKKKKKGADSGSSSSGSSDAEEDDVDIGSSFVQSAAKGKLGHSNLTASNVLPHVGKITVMVSGEVSADEREAKKLAWKAMERFRRQDFAGSATLLTKAMDLNPKDYRYLNNRACCYELLGNYDSALDDAERVIFINPQLASGYIQKARALEGLERFVEADAAYSKLYNLKRANLQNVPMEAVDHCRRRMTVAYLARLGYSQSVAEIAYLTYGSLKKASDALMSKRDDIADLAEMFSSAIASDEEEELFQILTPTSSTESHVPASAVNKDREHTYSGGRSCSPESGSGRSSSSFDLDSLYTDPKNPFRTCSIWVGNISPDATEQNIRTIFADVGDVANIHMALGYAFVNFSHYKEAGRAMEKFQDAIIFGQQMNIRYPEAAPKETLLTDPTNKIGSKSLWVGNVAPNVTKTDLELLFGRFGQLVSVAITPDKHSAFVNFTNPKSATNAMIWLQGRQFHGGRLFIKFPYAAVQGRTV